MSPSPSPSTISPHRVNSYKFKHKYIYIYTYKHIHTCKRWFIYIYIDDSTYMYTFSAEIKTMVTCSYSVLIGHRAWDQVVNKRKCHCIEDTYAHMQQNPMRQGSSFCAPIVKKTTSKKTRWPIAPGLSPMGVSRVENINMQIRSAEPHKTINKVCSFD